MKFSPNDPFTVLFSTVKKRHVYFFGSLGIAL